MVVNGKPLASLVLSPQKEEIFQSDHSAKLVKVKVKFTLEEATKTQRGSTGIALLFP
jgi:hypothetical protein